MQLSSSIEWLHSVKTWRLFWPMYLIALLAPSWRVRGCVFRVGIVGLNMILVGWVECSGQFQVVQSFLNRGCREVRSLF